MTGSNRRPFGFFHFWGFLTAECSTG